jgi:hypothetical protein
MRDKTVYNVEVGGNARRPQTTRTTWTRRENNIKMDIEWGGMDWIRDRDRDQLFTFAPLSKFQLKTETEFSL